MTQFWIPRRADSLPTCPLPDCRVNLTFSGGGGEGNEYFSLRCDMRKLMVLTARGGDELAGEVFSKLHGLEYEVFDAPSGGELPQAEIEQADVFIVVGSRGSALEKLAAMLAGDDLLKAVPRLIVTTAEVLDKLDYCRLADEILVAPFCAGELEARLRMLSWRLSRVDPSNQIECGDLVINLATYEVTLSGAPVDLTFKEYELLRYLVSHRRRVHSRRELLIRVWGDDYYGGARTVDVHVRRIRAKIEQGGRDYIQTVRGVGYRFIG